jgi:hypothetical protein
MPLALTSLQPLKMCTMTLMDGTKFHKLNLNCAPNSDPG